MAGFLRKLFKNDRGNALIIAAGALPLVIGSAGLASDTIQWALWKRQLQRAADSAAIAGVYAKNESQDVTTAVNYDIDKGNNFVRSGTAVKKITLLNTPVIGYPADGSDYTSSVSVQLQIQQRLGFSSVFMASAPVITANATAAAVASGDYCVISLENTNTTGITAGGSTTVNFGCGMITNSTSLDAAVAFGTSSVSATPVAAVGGLNSTDNWAAGTTLLPFTIAQSDPFASVNPPSIPSPCNTQFNDSPQTVQTWPSTAPTAPVCLKSFTASGTVTLQPGTYIITGNLNVNSGAKVNCSACTFIMTNPTPSQTGTVTINGGAQLNLTAPSSGTYKGILFYQDRGASSSGSMNKINGNSASFFQGAFYFPNQNVTYNGTAGLTFNCVQLVARQITFTGNSSLSNNCPANSGASSFKGRHVRLVA